MLVRTGLRGALALALGVVALGCSVELATPAKPGKTPPSARPSADVGKASTPPGPNPSARPAVPAVPLVRPPGEVTVIKGAVVLDAGRLVAAGAGNVVSAGGSSLVAAGGLNLIGLDGGTLVGQDGATLAPARTGNMIAAGGLNMIAAGAGNLVGNDGSSLVGNDGSSLIGNDGSSLVGNDGSSLVAAGAGNYALFQLLGAAGAAPGATNGGPRGAAAATPTPAANRPAIGETLPVVAMRVGLIDLRTGKAIPCGRTPSGEPVYAIYTNLAGEFELYAPAALGQYVRLGAEAPSAPAVAVNVLVDPDVGQARVDEEQAIVMGYLRHLFSERMADLIRKPPAQLREEIATSMAGDREAGSFDTFMTVVEPLLQEFSRVAQAKDLMGLPPAEQEAIARRAADTLLSACDFKTTTCDQLSGRSVLRDGKFVREPISWRGSEDPLSVLAAVFHEIREGAGAKMRAQVAAGKPIEDTFSFAAALTNGQVVPKVREGADLPTFMVDNFLSGPGAGIGPRAELERLDKMQAFQREVGLLSQADQDGRAYQASYAVVSHMLQVFTGIGGRAVPGYDSARAAVLDVFKRAKGGPKAQQDPTP